MGALPKRFFTPEEYLLLEERAPYKSQYIDGEIFPMGEAVTGDVSAMGGTQPAHVLITTNVAAGLHFQFRGRPCRAYSSDLRVAVDPGKVYTYPDVTALCDKPRFETARQPSSLLNPQVVFEVLSPSTESFDRGDKFARYRLLASLTDYVLIASDRLRVEHFARQADGGWSLRVCGQPTERLLLTSVTAELLLAEIYDKVDFTSSGADQ